MLKMPRILDADDTRMVARLVVYSMLLIWAAVVVALALGLAIRAFMAVAWG